MVPSLHSFTRESSHLEDNLACLLVTGQVGQDGADLIREHVLWIHEPLKQHRQNVRARYQSLEDKQGR